MAQGTVTDLNESQVEAMPLDRFWEIVSLADWETHCETPRGYGLSKRILKRELPTLGDMFSFRERYENMLRVLGRTVEEWERRTRNSIPVSGDGWSDLSAHIVGLGQESYEESVGNPELVMQRASSGRFVESFSYSIPYDDEYQAGHDELSRRRRQRDCEIKAAEDQLLRVLEPAVDLVIRESTILTARDLIGALDSVCTKAQWVIRRALPASIED